MEDMTESYNARYAAPEPQATGQPEREGGSGDRHAETQSPQLADDGPREKKEHIEREAILVPTVADPEPTGAEQDDTSVSEEGAGPQPHDFTVYEHAVQRSSDLLLSEMKALQQAFNTKLKYDTHKQDIIDKLHAELQRYKGDLLAHLVQPVLYDLIGFYDDLGQVWSHYQAHEAKLSPKESLKQIKRFQQFVLDILEKHNIWLYVNETATFDPKTQQAKHITKTQDPSLDRQVRESLRPGFRRGQHVMRPEVVDVFSYQRPATPQLAEEPKTAMPSNSDTNTEMENESW